MFTFVVAAIVAGGMLCLFWFSTPIHAEGVCAVVAQASSGLVGRQGVYALVGLLLVFAAKEILNLHRIRNGLIRREFRNPSRWRLSEQVFFDTGFRQFPVFRQYALATVDPQIYRS